MFDSRETGMKSFMTGEKKMRREEKGRIDKKGEEKGTKIEVWDNEKERWRKIEGGISRGEGGIW